MKKLASLILFALLPGFAYANPYDDIAHEIVTKSAKLVNKKIAILPLTYLGEKESPAPQIISERLTTRIFRLGGVDVVERIQLEQLLAEKKLELTGLTEEREAGKMLGVDGIVTGTVSEIGDGKVETNVRLISVAEGKVLAAITRPMEKTWERSSKPAPKPKPVEAATPPPATVRPTTGLPAALTLTYMASRRSNKYHRPDCTWARRINPDNLITFASKDLARQAGYIPCKVCRP